MPAPSRPLAPQAALSHVEAQLATANATLAELRRSGVPAPPEVPEGGARGTVAVTGTRSPASGGKGPALGNASAGCGADSAAQVVPEAMAGQPVLSDSAPSDPPSCPSPSPSPSSSPALGAAPPPSPGFGASIVVLVSGITSYAFLKSVYAALARGLGKFFTRSWSRTRAENISVGVWMAVPLALIVSVDQVATQIRVAVWFIYLGLVAREIRAMGDWALPVTVRTVALTCSLALALMEVLSLTRGFSHRLTLYVFSFYLPLLFIFEPTY